MSRLLALLIVGWALGGCDRGDETQAAIDQGGKREKAGAFQEAIRSYEFALDGTEKTAELHYKIAFIYDDKLKNPVGAIHHYNRYLELAPDGRRAKDAREGRAECDKRMTVATKPGGFMTLAEGARLQNDNQNLRRQIEELRHPKPTPPPRVPGPNEPDRPPPGSTKHVVAKGETLASIAFKYYRNKSQIARIRSANLQQLRGSDVIKPGMTLIIPPIPAKRKP